MCSLVVVCVYSSAVAPRDGKVEDLDDDVQGYLPCVVAAAVAFITIVAIAVSVFVYRLVAFLIHLLLTNFKNPTPVLLNFRHIENLLTLLLDIAIQANGEI